MIKNNAAGSINGVGYKPGQLIELVRNPNWRRSTSWRPAYADKVLFKEGYQDATVQARTILAGGADVNGDTPPPPAELKSILANSTQRKQLVFTPTGGSRYIALNTARLRSTSSAVREAVAYVLDRNAMRLTRGGAIDGRIATHFIDPGFGSQGFTQAGGYSFNPFPSAGFNGNVAKAKQLLRQAGYANGMYSGPQLTMVADNTPPGSNTAQVVAAAMAKIGFNVKTISVTHSTMYTQLLQRAEERAATSARTSAGFPTSTTRRRFSTSTFNGKQSHPSTTRTGRSERPEDQRAMVRAERLLDPRARAAAWGKLDQTVARDRRRGSLALGELSDAVLPPRHGSPRALERGLPGRHLHGGHLVVAHVDETRHRAFRPPERFTGGRKPSGGAPPGPPLGLAGSSMLRYIVRRILWGALLLLSSALLTFLIFYTLPSADPAALRAGRPGNARADRSDPPLARSRPADLRPVLAT